jgi:hypothetical protein
VRDVTRRGLRLHKTPRNRSFVRTVALCPAIAAAVFIGCAQSTAPSLATAVVEVAEVSTSQNGGVTAEVMVANATADTIYFNFCATSLERQIDDKTWLPVGGVLCSAIGYGNPFHGMVAIPARGYRRTTIHFYVSQPIHNLDGTNRFRLRVQAVAGFPPSWWKLGPVAALAMQGVISNEFDLDVP